MTKLSKQREIKTLEDDLKFFQEKLNEISNSPEIPMSDDIDKDFLKKIINLGKKWDGVQLNIDKFTSHYFHAYPIVTKYHYTQKIKYIKNQLKQLKNESNEDD